MEANKELLSAVLEFAGDHKIACVTVVFANGVEAECWQDAEGRFQCAEVCRT